MPTEKQTDSVTSKSASNLPLTFSPFFSCDDMALILGTCLFPGAFICDLGSGDLVACNQNFLELLSLDPDAFAQTSPTWSSFLKPDVPERIRNLAESELESFETQFDTQLLIPNAGELSIRLKLKALRWKQRAYVVGFVESRDRELGREADLRRQIDEQKRRAVTAIASSLRVYHLTEKIKWTPIITRDLLRLDSPEALFRQAGKLLTEESSLNYREATFFLVGDERLTVAFSTRDWEKDSIRPAERPDLWSFVRASEAIGDSDSGILIRLESRGKLLGLCEVLPYERETEFFDSIGKISELQKDFLSALGDIMGLLVDNIGLNQEIKKQSISDPLTGTFNRRYFMECLHEEMERALRYDRALSLAFIDLDGFKEVNDIQGHLQGDQVLKEIGAILNRCFRENDVVCRYGGDEFVVLLPETTAEMALQAGEKLVETVKNHTFSSITSVSEFSLPVTVSAGISTLTPDYTHDEFLQAADVALFKAKRQGKNGVASYP